MRLDRCDGCTHTRESHALVKNGGACLREECDCKCFRHASTHRGTSLPRTTPRRHGAGRQMPGVGGGHNF